MVYNGGMGRRSGSVGLWGIVACAWACNSGDAAPGASGLGGSGGSAAGGAVAGFGGNVAAGGSAAAGGSGASSSSAAGAAGTAAGGSAGADGGSTASPGAGGSAQGGRAVAYVGSYQNAIYVYAVDLQTGALTAQGSPVNAPPSPSFLAVSPDGEHLYAVNEADDIDGTGAGAVSAFRIDPATGNLSFINRVSSGGAGPAHVLVDRGGAFALVANYNGGNFSVLALEAGGGLGARVSGAGHGDGAQAHQVVLDPSNEFLFVANKGRSDLSLYRFDSDTGIATPNTPAELDLAPGAGTRHLAFHPSLPFAYVINELDDTVTVASFAPSTGALTVLETLSTLPAGVDGGQNSCAEIQVAPSGQFVYGSNRGHDSIVIYSVNAATGRLTLVGHQPTGGHTPRSFHIDTSGRLLLVANQGSNAIVSFRVDTATGRLTELSRTNVPSPAFVGVLHLEPRAPSR